MADEHGKAGGQDGTRINLSEALTPPCEETKADRTPPAIGEIAAAARCSYRVLIVDDNRDGANALGLLFELDGHLVRIVHDGPGAVAAASTFEPQIILLDIGLPGLDGNETARRIRALDGPARPFILALTGWGGPSDRNATRESGCDLHLVKPISIDELRETIRDLFRKNAGG